MAFFSFILGVAVDHRGARRSAEKLSFFGVRCIASEAYSYEAGQFSKSKLILSYRFKRKNAWQFNAERFFNGA
jgi:hypothetical protein